MARALAQGADEGQDCSSCTWVVAMLRCSARIKAVKVMRCTYCDVHLTQLSSCHCKLAARKPQSAQGQT